MRKETLTAERLRESLTYNPKTGIFIWKAVNKHHKEKTGKRAGYFNEYVIIGLDGITYRAHRLAWLYVYGKFPKKMIDHKNGNRLDNRITNLLPVNNYKNTQNHLKKRNGSGLPCGVRKLSYGSFHTRITVNKKVIYLGTFKTIEEASNAYVKAKKKFHYCPAIKGEQT